jgi:hypothetical protein
MAQIKNDGSQSGEALVFTIVLMQEGIRRAVQKIFYVILNEVKDLMLIEKVRFFAALRMTKM